MVVVGVEGENRDSLALVNCQIAIKKNIVRLHSLLFVKIFLQYRQDQNSPIIC